MSAVRRKEIAEPVVPTKVLAAVRNALWDFEEVHRNEYQFLREFLTARVQAIRQSEGWVFDKNYRHEASTAHSLVYALISTVAANCETKEQVEKFFGAGKNLCA